MKCYLEVVATPTSDTPGTLLVLHYDDRRYLIGNLAEGSSRACLQYGLALRKVDDIFLTGRAKWSNIGGMLGMMLGLADMKKAAADAQSEQEEAKVVQREKRETGVQNEVPAQNSKENPKGGSPLFLRMHGPPNLNYAIATARRFIFRTGLPIEATEHACNTEPPATDLAHVAPTWTDNHLQVWAMPIKSVTSSAAADVESAQRPRSRKRSHEEMTSGSLSDDDGEESLSKRIVKQMFDSDWRMDRLFPKPLKDVQMPATVFVRDAQTGQLAQYTGPLPGSGRQVPDIQVLVRQPWPGALTEKLLPVEPAPESLCYVVKNHPQRGKFMPKKALELGLEDRTVWGQLTKGHNVRNKDGQEITPEMVLEPGKQGSGFAMVELPTADYVPDLVSRPEWQDSMIMEGLSAIVWILGPDVSFNSQLQKFQDGLPNVKHIVSFPDLGGDALVLETAVRSAWRHNYQESEVYPRPRVDSNHLRGSKATAGIATPDHIVQARPNLVLNLEPAVSLDQEHVQKPMDGESLSLQVKEDHDRMLKEASDLIISEPSSQLPSSTTSRTWYTEPPWSNIEVTTLGTGSSHPSTHRNVSGTLVRIPNLGSYIFDCGEGTLGSLRRMYNKPELDALLRDLRMISISHMHADHHLGTTSVISAWYQAVHKSTPGTLLDDARDLKEGDRRLAVVSDAPMLHWLREFSAIDDFGFSRLLPLATEPTRYATYPHKATPTKLRLATSAESIDSDTTPTSTYLSYIGLKNLSTVLVPHCRGAQAISCTFPLPPVKTTNSAAQDSSPQSFKLSYSGDTRPSRPFTFIGRNSHLLIHEATFDDDMRSEAFAKKHSTAGEALTVAKEMGAKLCILTHFSQRYPKMSGMGSGSVGGQGGTRKLKEMGLELNSTVLPLTNAKSDSQVKGNSKNEEAPDIPSTDTPDVPAESTQESDLTSQSLKFQPWSSPQNAQDLSPQYNSLLSHPQGITGAMAEAGIKVVPAFDYMRLKLGNFDKAVKVQPMLRAIEEFSEREKEDAKRRAREEEEIRKEEERRRKEAKRLEGSKKGNKGNPNKGIQSKERRKADGGKEAKGPAGG
ncbi:MAG: hypothetical protein Q9159_002977 [Coniocarpon cinnabarinum]